LRKEHNPSLSKRTGIKQKNPSISEGIVTI